MTTDPRYGNVRITKIKAAYDDLRAACRAEGTPRVQAAIDRYEQWADFAFMRQPVPPVLEDMRAAVDMARSRLEAIADQMMTGTRDGGLVGGRELKRSIEGVFAEYIALRDAQGGE